MWCLLHNIKPSKHNYMEKWKPKLAKDYESSRENCSFASSNIVGWFLLTFPKGFPTNLHFRSIKKMSNTDNISWFIPVHHFYSTESEPILLISCWAVYIYGRPKYSKLCQPVGIVSYQVGDVTLLSRVACAIHLDSSKWIAHTSRLDSIELPFGQQVISTGGCSLTG